MTFPKPVLVIALALAACGSSGDGSSDAGNNQNQDSGGLDPTGACTASGAATGTVSISAMCGAGGSSSSYVFAMVTASSAVTPAAAATFPFGASAPTLGTTYGLSDAVPSGQVNPVISFLNADFDTWVAGDAQSFKPTNGSVALKLTSCTTTATHGTLTATLTPVVGTGDVTLSCTF